MFHEGCCLRRADELSLFLWCAIINDINSCRYKWHQFRVTVLDRNLDLEWRDDAWMTKCFEKHTGFVFFFTNSLNYELQELFRICTCYFIFFIEPFWNVSEKYINIEQYVQDVLRLSAPVTGSQCHVLVFAFTFIAFFIVLYRASSCISTV